MLNRPFWSSIKPSSWLGFLLFMVWFVFFIFAVTQFIVAEEERLLEVHHWIVLGSVLAAVTGWVVSSIVTLRNSIRQHTIQTLLQTRLSATYMGYADKVSAHYMEYDKKLKDNPSESCQDPLDGIDEPSLRYILNYFEFIAVGIRYQDLNEKMLKDSMLSILKMNVNKSHDWIMASRTISNRHYSNLAWLHSRWCTEEKSLLLESEKKDSLFVSLRRWLQE